jgi:hypothetical protein
MLGDQGMQKTAGARVKRKIHAVSIGQSGLRA